MEPGPGWRQHRVREQWGAGAGLAAACAPVFAWAPGRASLGVPAPREGEAAPCASSFPLQEDVTEDTGTRVRTPSRGGGLQSAPLGAPSSLSAVLLASAARTPPPPPPNSLRSWQAWATQSSAAADSSKPRCGCSPVAKAPRRDGQRDSHPGRPPKTPPSQAAVFVLLLPLPSWVLSTGGARAACTSNTLCSLWGYVPGAPLPHAW